MAGLYGFADCYDCANTVATYVLGRTHDAGPWRADYSHPGPRIGYRVMPRTTQCLGFGPRLIPSQLALAKATHHHHQMIPPASRLLRLLALAAILWVIYLAPWPGPGVLEPLKPTLVTVAFALLAQRLRVGSWPLVIAFSLTFFIHGVIAAYVQSLSPGSDYAGSSGNERGISLYLWALIFSPISLWGPLLFGTAAYALAVSRR